MNYKKANKKVQEILNFWTMQPDSEIQFLNVWKAEELLYKIRLKMRDEIGNLNEMYTDPVYIKTLDDIEKSHSIAFKINRHFSKKWQPVHFWLSKKLKFIEEPIPF